jgi:sn-glycerol 3-phosphate transport system substrate-binding protein
MKKAGLNPEMDLSTWKQVGNALDAANAKGIDCGLTTAWHSWIHLENFSAYHDLPFATKGNGFAGLNTELSFNSPVHIKHIQTLGKWSQEGKFKYLGRRNESGKNFRAGECMLMTESSAGRKTSESVCPPTILYPFEQNSGAVPSKPTEL